MLKKENSGSAGVGHKVALPVHSRGLRACEQQVMLTRTGLCQAPDAHNHTDSSLGPLKEKHLDSPFIVRVHKSTSAKVTEPISGRVRGASRLSSTSS